MLDVSQITRLHDEATVRWHQGRPSPGDAEPLEKHPQPAAGLAELALAQHRTNYDLWHEEDLARAPGATDADLARIKRAIDALNQRRNNLMEAMDASLLEAAGPQQPSAPLHSESPGLILDRLSILALKLYHTAEESRRATGSEAHRQRNLDRLHLLQEQRADLAACLDALWAGVLAGTRRFKLFRQLKMYNDPELNPVVYSHKAGTQAGRSG
jgi:hypothetical protein